MIVILLVAAAVAASPVPVRGPVLGEQVKVGDATFRPSAALDLDLKREPQSGIYRHLSVKRNEGQPPVGYYPAAAFAARKEGDVLLRLTVAADGKPTACQITEPSGIAELDDHSCGHALAQTAFNPGLDDKGRRFGGTVEGMMSYTLYTVIRTATIEDMGWNRLSRQAAPLRPITLDTLGIARGVELDIGTDAIRAMLALDARGSVTACLLTQPTFDDALDKGACDRLREQRFGPALDREQRPVASLYAVRLDLPR